MSHRGVLPDNIKGSHSEKSSGQETIPADTSLGPRCLLSSLPARYWHCSSAHLHSACLVPRGDHSFHLSSFSLVSVTLVVYFMAFLCVTLCWHAAGSLWGSARHTEDCARLRRGYSSLTWRQGCVCVCVRCVRTHACASQWPGVDVCTRQWVCYFLYVWARSPLKKTDIHYHTRTARQQVGGNLCLFVRLCYHLLFPVKTGKDRGENGA